MNLVSLLNSLPNMLEVTGETKDFRVLEHIGFNDVEYKISVQASRFHYCIPRETVAFDEYTHFEVMLDIPSYDIPSEWELYNACDNVYGFVPKELIEQLIDDLTDKYK